MQKILVVDDDNLILECFQYAFPSDLYDIRTATTATQALSDFRQTSFDVVIVDVRLPDQSGMEVLERLHAIDAKVPVILMTGHGTSKTAIEAMRQGAYQYLLKPLDLDELRTVLEQALEASRMSRTPVVLPMDNSENPEDGDQMVGYCPAMQEVYRHIGRVAGQNVTVLILGESGTGKEVVARAIYQHSKRASRPFLAINCAAIPENLLESELFGHEKGAFTGAERTRVGKFEQCDGGTLFLDEIGDMTPLTQTKVLRVLQDQQFERVGGTELVKTSVRLIAATNRDLSEMMKDGTFRSDLYYRLNVYTIHLPPLRERNGDLPLLITHFLKQFSRELDKTIQSISPEAMRLLMDYKWPGNIRELQSVLKHAIVESTGPVILPEFLPKSLCGVAGESDTKSTGGGEVKGTEVDHLKQFVEGRIRAGSNSLHEDVIQRVEKQVFSEVLQHVDGNLSRAAAILGISRSTLRSKLALLGINLDRAVRMTTPEVEESICLP